MSSSSAAAAAASGYNKSNSVKEKLLSGEGENESMHAENDVTTAKEKEKKRRKKKNRKGENKNSSGKVSLSQHNRTSSRREAINECLQLHFTAANHLPASLLVCCLALYSVCEQSVLRSEIYETVFSAAVKNYTYL